jgi:hypothetical protein
LAAKFEQQKIKAGHAVSTDRSTVEAVVKNYFDALYEGDADKMGTVFDASADLRWVEKGELQVLKVPEWLDRIRKRPSAKAEGKSRYFTDYLVAMKLSDGWRIVSKSYRYDVKD